MSEAKVEIQSRGENMSDLSAGQIRVHTECLKATICGVEYTWFGGFGAVMKSFERGVKLNEVRMIGNVVFYAYLVGRSGWLREISWCPQQEISAQWIRDFKAAVFG